MEIEHIEQRYPGGLLWKALISYIPLKTLATPDTHSSQGQILCQTNSGIRHGIYDWISSRPAEHDINKEKIKVVKANTTCTLSQRVQTLKQRPRVWKTQSMNCGKSVLSVLVRTYQLILLMLLINAIYSALKSNLISATKIVFLGHLACPLKVKAVRYYYPCKDIWTTHTYTPVSVSD